MKNNLHNYGKLIQQNKNKWMIYLFNACSVYKANHGILLLYFYICTDIMFDFFICKYVGLRSGINEYMKLLNRIYSDV